MSRGSRRGCIPLKKAIMGIDDVDDCTFTLHSDGRTFHFQGWCGKNYSTHIRVYLCTDSQCTIVEPF